MPNPTSDLIAYVNSLHVPHAPPQKIGLKREFAVADPGPGQASAAIDAGSLVAFTANVTAQHRSDALNSTLIAQLHADTLYDKSDNTEVMNWYRAYLEVLTNVGWPSQAFQFQNYNASGSSFAIDAAVTSIVASFVDPAQLAVVQAALSALDNLGSGDPWYKVWDSSTHTATGGGFQLSMCTDAPGTDNQNTLVMKVSAYAFQTTESTTRFLWESYNSSDTSLQYTTATMVLDEDVYSLVRDSIVAKLGANATNYIGNLNI